MCVGIDAARGTAQRTKNRRLVVRVKRLRQRPEVALDQRRDRRSDTFRVPFCAPDDALIDAQRKFRHIRIMQQNDTYNDSAYGALGLVRAGMTFSDRRSVDRRGAVVAADEAVKAADSRSGSCRFAVTSMREPRGSATARSNQ